MAEVPAALLGSIPVAHSPAELERRMRSYPQCVVKQTPDGRGRGLFAAAPISAGETIMIEESFCWQVAGLADKRLFTNVGFDDLPHLLLEMAPFGDRPVGPASDLTLETVVDAVFSANSFGVVEEASTSEAFRDAAITGDSAMDARALFLCLCIANHSCAPTARAAQQLGKPGSPPVFALEARYPIAVGEEITVAYLPRVWPLAKRAQFTRIQWGFACACLRCSRPGGADDTVCLRCGTCGNGRVFWSAEGVDTLCCLDCSTVGAACVPSLEGWEARHCASKSPGSHKPAAVQTRDAAAAVLDIVLDRDRMIGDVFDFPLPITVIAEKLLQHPLLAHEDARIFGALSTLLSYLDPPNTGTSDDAKTSEALVYEEVVVALATAASRAPFVCPSDLGFEVEES